MPAEWTCIKCEHTFEFSPTSEEMPYAYEVITDKTGFQKYLGDICRTCYEASKEKGQTK